MLSPSTGDLTVPVDNVPGLELSAIDEKLQNRFHPGSDCFVIIEKLFIIFHLGHILPVAKNSCAVF
jgi:hypothetical protein